MTDEEVLATFMAFSNFGAGAQSPSKMGMDGARFAKLCRETGLQAGKLNSISVDIIFSKIKAKVSALLARHLHVSPCAARVCTSTSNLAILKNTNMRSPISLHSEVLWNPELTSEANNMWYSVPP